MGGDRKQIELYTIIGWKIEENLFLTGGEMEKRLEPFDTFDHFERVPGSDEWPSTDPKNSPFDEFICRHCNRVGKIQMYGSLPVGESFEEKARVILRDHLGLCPKFDRATAFILEGDKIKFTVTKDGGQ